MLQNVTIMMNKQAIKKNRKYQNIKYQNIKIFLKRINIFEGLQTRQNNNEVNITISVSVICL